MCIKANKKLRTEVKFYKLKMKKKSISFHLSVFDQRLPKMFNDMLVETQILAAVYFYKSIKRKTMFLILLDGSVPWKPIGCY